jgi:hypothetical protein
MKTSEIGFELKVLIVETCLLNHVHLYSLTHQSVSGLVEDWYVGITGQDDTNSDGNSERIQGHKQTFPDLVENSWKECPINEGNAKTRDDIAQEAETRMQARGFDAGERVQGQDVHTIYVFLKGATDNRNSE